MSATLNNEEVQPIVEKLVASHPINLSEIQPDRILYLKGKGKKRPVTLTSVKNPWDLCTKYRFVLTVHGPKYDKLDDNKKAIAIFDELLRIKDFEGGSISGHTVVGNLETLATWGLDWLDTDETLAPIFKGENSKEG